MTEVQVDVRELKTNLSKYLRDIKRGQTIVITEHGQALGRLLPASPSRTEKMAALQQAGLLRWNGQKLLPVTNRPKVREPRSVADLLIKDRS